jgi:predicted nucleic acid-binding protein
VITLVDTSAWIDFFRGERAAMKRVDGLLEQGEACLCGPVLSEVLSRARDRVTYQRLSVLLGALPRLAPAADEWQRVADLRFLLARQGTQAHLIDLLIAVTAADCRASLLTRDRDFKRIAGVLSVDLVLF